MLIQLSKTCAETHLERVASSRKQVRQCLKLPIKQKKRAAIFGGRPLLEIGMLFQDGQVTSRAT
jgi:hypothetical protein